MTAQIAVDFGRLDRYAQLSGKTQAACALARRAPGIDFLFGTTLYQGVFLSKTTNARLHKIGPDAFGCKFGVVFFKTGNISVHTTLKSFTLCS